MWSRVLPDLSYLAFFQCFCYVLDCQSGKACVSCFVGAWLPFVKRQIFDARQTNCLAPAVGTRIPTACVLGVSGAPPALDLQIGRSKGRTGPAPWPRYPLECQLFCGKSVCRIANRQSSFDKFAHNPFFCLPGCPPGGPSAVPAAVWPPACRSPTAQRPAGSGRSWLAGWPLPVLAWAGASLTLNGLHVQISFGAVCSCVCVAPIG